MDNVSPDDEWPQFTKQVLELVGMDMNSNIYLVSQNFLQEASINFVLSFLTPELFCNYLMK